MDHPRIELNPQGLPVIQGTNIGVLDLLERLAKDEDIQALLDEYAAVLSREDIVAALEYAVDNIRTAAANDQDFFTADDALVTDEYRLAPTEILEVMQAWLPKLKDWAEGKSLNPDQPPELEVPEQFKNRAS